MIEYTFRGFAPSGVSAQDAGEELERIRKNQRGKLTPDDVVAIASQGGPLHSAFEWDDGVAGHQYRLGQARRLIRAVRVIVNGDTAPMFVHVEIDKGDRYYQSVTVALRNKAEFNAALAGLREHLAAAARSVDDLLVASNRTAPHGSKTKLRRVAKVVEEASQIAGALT